MSEKTFDLQPIPTTYNGVKFRSRVEARWALFFDHVGLRHQYEPDGFVVREGAYLPDFWLPDIRMFFEVKGVDPGQDEVIKCSALARAADFDVLLAVGAPEERFQIRWFDGEGLRDGLYTFAHDRYAEAGFWLVGETSANCIGPAKRAPSGPLFFTMEPAYAAARSARFGGRTPRVTATVFPADAYELAA